MQITTAAITNPWLRPNIFFIISARATFTHPIIMQFIKIPRYIALKPLKKAAGFPEYRISINSTSVSILALLQSLAKKNTVNMLPATIFHHSQFPEMPFWATSSVTARGVSAEKVVATMPVPAIHQGSFLPERKNSSVLLPALFLKYNAIRKLIIK